MQPVTATRRVFELLAAQRAELVRRDDAILADQIAIAEIPAPTGDERRRGAYVASRLAARGRTVVTDEAGNIVAMQPGTASEAPVVVCAHLDTVFPAPTPLAVRRQQRRLIGPGISDNARGLAVMLGIADVLLPERVSARRPIIWTATVGEEGDGDLRGARHLFAGIARQAHAAIAIDGAGDDRIVSAALGCRRFRIAFHGSGGHSWAAYGTPNAVHAAGTLIARLAAERLPAAPRTTLTVSRVGGGTAVNAIPSDAWIDVDLRSTSPAELARLDEEIRRHAHATLDEQNARRLPGTPLMAVRIHVTGDRPSGSLPAEDELVRSAMEATRLVQRAPELAVASTDANIPLSLGIPAIAIGAGGRAGETHTPVEWYDNRDGACGVARALTIIAAAADLA